MEIEEARSLGWLAEEARSLGELVEMALIVLVE